MRALRFDRFGEPNVLSVSEVPDPVATVDQAVVEVKAGSVNPSDVKNVAGAMEGTVLPRVPGRDFAGVVLEGPSRWIGAEVWGTGGDAGFTVDGSHSERIAIPVSAIACKPEGLTFEEASTIGVDFVVGWQGTVETAGLARGETIAVFGVSGGVGGAVAQIAKMLGACVLGVARTVPADGTPAAEAIDEFVRLTDSPGEVSNAIRRLTGGRGADVVYDSVGGVTTASALGSLAQRGRLVVISAVGTRSVEIDLVDFYRREIRMLGSDSRKLDLTASAKRLKLLTPYFDRGVFRPLPIGRVFDLDHGPEAYTAVADGADGRVVIRP